MYKDFASFMDDTYEDAAAFPPEDPNGKWMHAVNTDIEYRYRLDGLYEESDAEDSDASDGEGAADADTQKAE